MKTIHEKMAHIGAEEAVALFDLLCEDLNLGAGIQVSGDSGSGKSNLGELLFIRSFERGIPSIFFDPHGDSTKKIRRVLLEKSRSRAKERLIYLNVADLSTAFGFNPLHTTHDPDDIVPYESQVLKRVETTSKIIFSLFGESEFEGRTKLRQYLTLWISMLAKSGLTLGDAPIFADPDSPIYQQLVELAPTERIRNKLAKLIGQKPSEVEKEIGSTESRVMPVLAHPVCQMMFTRRENNLDFRWLIENDYSLLVDLSLSGTSRDGQEYPDALTEEVQQLVCTLMLNQYLDVLKTVPLPKRKRRLLFIDELPVFESSGPQLLKACTEIRKFQTKFVFMHQGSTRFPGGTDNEFFKAICKMCAANVYFRHTGEDAEYFAAPVARRFFDPVEVKYEHWVDQQFTLEPEIVDLFSESNGRTLQESTSVTNSEQSQVTDTKGSSDTRSEGGSSSLGQTESSGHNTVEGSSIKRADDSSDDDVLTDNSSSGSNYSSAATNTQSTSHEQSHGTNESHAVGHGKGKAVQEGTSNATTSSTTRSQALKGRAETRRVLQSVNFKPYEEQNIESTDFIETLQTGRAVVVVKGVGIVSAQFPEVKCQLANLTSIVDRYVREFMNRQLELPWFSDANEAYRNRLAFEASMSSHLQLMIDERRNRVNPLVLESGIAETAESRSVESVVDKSQVSPRLVEAKSKVSQSDPDEYDGAF